jgi:anti-sigma factor RsiW
MTRHVSTERLARFRDGGLRRAAARRVEAHLADCARCRDAEHALDQLPALLAAAEAPQIPAHLAARIETALATESAHRAAGSPSMRGSGPELPRSTARTRSRLTLPVPALRILAAAGVVVVIGGGGYELISHTVSTGAHSTSGSAASAGRPAVRSPHRTFNSAGSGPVVPGISGGAAFGPIVRYARDGHLASIRPVRTSTDYRPAHLSQQVTATLARTRPGPRVQPGTHPEAGPEAAGRLSTAQRARLAGCLSRVAGGRPVLLADIATFRGDPATVIVTAAQGHAAAQIWVVGPGCSRSASDVLAHQPLRGS